MAKDQETVTMTRAELQELIATATKAVSENATSLVADALAKLADSIAESRKPYVDPRQAENDAAMRKSMREATERMRQQILASQETCPHLQGSSENSDFTGQLSAIVKHRLDTGVVVGICTNCQKQIFSNDPNPEVQKLFRMKSGNRMSSAGVRTFLDPMAAMKAGRLQ
jgi:hypothetical protein